MQYLFAGLTLLLICSAVFADGEQKEVKTTTTTFDFNSNYITPMTMEEIARFRPKEVRKRCNLSAMSAFSLYADAPSLSYKNPVCPNLKENCCGPTDVKKIPLLWKSDQKRMQIRNVAYLKIMRYLIGFSKEYYRIAQKLLKYSKETGKQKSKTGKKPLTQTTTKMEFDFTKEKLDDCVKAAKDFEGINYDNKIKAKMLYERLSNRARFLQTLRQKFYCTMCAARPHNVNPKYGPVTKAIVSAFTYRTNKTIRKSHKLVKLPKEVCYNIGKMTVDVAYDLYHNYGRFLSNMMRVSKCINIKNNLFATTEKSYKNFVENPLKLKKFFDKLSIKTCKDTLEKGHDGSDCRNYCKRFSLGGPTSMFDGHMDRAIDLFDFFEQLEEFMKDRNKNIFGDDVIQLKTQIRAIMDKTQDLYFRPVNPSINIAKFKTKFNWFISDDKYYNDPFKVGDKTTLYFKYKSAGIISAIITAVTLWASI